MTWDELDWSILDRLRQGFLSGTAAHGPYWRTPEDLAHYDFTFAERIGWKWDHVLRELEQRGWSPPRGVLLDWGCGSGVAHRRVQAQWPTAITALQVMDHSLLAENFSLGRIVQTAPQLSAQSWDRNTAVTTLVISHVLTELDEDSAADLMATICAAQAVIWIEPGTSEVAQQLVEWREKLRDNFRFVYPCPHQGVCGMRTPENARHWCHHFAAPPPEVGADSNWVKFGQRAKIDLRSLPYSALVMERAERAVSPPTSEQLGRIIGRPSVAKPYTRFLGCDADSVQTLELPKRLSPTLAKKLDRATAPRLLHWQQTNGKVTKLSPLPPSD